MNLRRIFMLAGVLLVLFLGIYSWNRRTHALDELAANVGLEISYLVLAPLDAILEGGGNFWERYFDLVGVREENVRLKARVSELDARLLAQGEAIAELERLRALVEMPLDASWRPIGCRVLSGRLGPNAVLDSITIARGYANGARPGMPVITNLGLVGKVLRASPHAATVLLVTDPKSSVAVFGQETRAPGILKGRGMANGMEVDFVQRAMPVKNGEVLVTSGLDGKYPKGLPVARVQDVAPSDYTQFMAVSAAPLVDLAHLEEALLLEKTGVQVFYEEVGDPLSEIVGPPLPPKLEKIRKEKAQQAAGPEARMAKIAAPAQPETANSARGSSSPAGSSPAGNSNRAEDNQVTSGQPAPAANSANNPAANGPAGSAANSAVNPAARPLTRPAVTPPLNQQAGAGNPAASPARRTPAAEQGQPVPRNAEGAPKWRVITP